MQNSCEVEVEGTLIKCNVHLYRGLGSGLRPRVEDVILWEGCEVGTSDGGMRRSLCVPIVGSPLAPQ